MGIIQNILAYFKIGNSRKEEPVEVDPHTRLQQIIDEQATRLAAGQTASRLSADLVHRLRQERDCLAVDVQTLENRKADPLRLESKRRDLVDKSAELEHAAEEHRKNLAVIAEYNEIIAKARAEANRLKVDLDMARVSQEAARFQSSLSVGSNEDSAADVRSEIEREIRKARAMAEVDRSLLPDTSSDEQFLKAAEGK